MSINDTEYRKISSCLENHYDITVKDLWDLTLGADQYTKVYRLESSDNKIYLIKVRQGYFNKASVHIPDILHQHGFNQVIPPQPNQNQRLWTEIGPDALTVYPFIEGQNAYQHQLSQDGWKRFGKALKDFHSTSFPQEVINALPGEEFSPRWRNRLRVLLEELPGQEIANPTGIELRDFLKPKQAEIITLLKKAEELALLLLDQVLNMIPCHGDIHGWNLHIDDQDQLYILDWDTVILAPRERDLMFIGGGLGESGYSALEEVEMFFLGYGKIEINQAALAYFRYERVIEDITIYIQLILSGDHDEKDQITYFENLMSNFSPHGTIVMADQAYDTFLNSSDSLRHIE